MQMGREAPFMRETSRTGGSSNSTRIYKSTSYDMVSVCNRPRSTKSRRLVLRLVDHFVLGDPRHHGTQLGADFFDLVLGGQTTARDQGRSAGLVFQDEGLGVFAGLDVLQALAHRVLGGRGDDFRAGHVFAVFGVVGDRVVNVGDAAFIDQVDDQFQFVQALEVRHLRRVAGFGQRFETSLDQLDGAAAQHGLLAEQVGLGFFAEVGLDDAGAAASVGRRVRQRDVARDAGLVLVDGDQVRHAATLGVGGAHGVARRFRRDHDDVEVGARHDLAVVDVEAVGEGQHRALLGVRGDVFVVDLGDVLVRQQDHDDVGGLDGDVFALDEGEVGVFVVENFHDNSYIFFNVMFGCRT